MTKAKRIARAGGTPLFVQVLVLMLGTLIAAQVINVFIIFNIPPPSPEFYPISEIIRAYNKEPLPGDRPLLIEKVRKPPKPTFDGDYDLRRRTQFAEGWRPRERRQPNRDKPNTRTTPANGPSGSSAQVIYKLKPQVTPEEVVLQSSYRRWFGSPNNPGAPRWATLTPQNQVALASDEPYLTAPFRVAVRQSDGSWTVIRTHQQFVLNNWQQKTLLSFLITSALIALAALLVARRVSAPMVSFAGAAQRLGRDPGAPPLTVTGSSEINIAAREFNDMQQRLRRYVEDRTAMVGAIAHDLRTPLTRLRFRIDGLPEEQQAKMAADLDEMEAMIAATLGFVRDATQTGKRTKLELSFLLESLADEMSETGKDVAVERANKVVMDGDPVSLKRLFANLLENAVKYGAKARIRVFSEVDMAVVEIDDSGPGVPPGELERVFDPFYRREPSRSRETGGIGLGLAVVRTIARAHGGDAELINRNGGGLTARVTLPL